MLTRSGGEPIPGLGTRATALALAAIAAAFFLVYHPALEAELALRDDHEIIRYALNERAHPDLPQGIGPITSRWKSAWTDNAAVGRFRLAYFYLRFALADFLATDAYLWHLSQLVLGILTCFFLFMAARTGGLGKAAAMLLVMWVALQGRAAETWVRLGPTESFAMLWLGVALYAVVRAAAGGRAWDVVSVVAMALMGGCKENFILLIPLLLALRVGLAGGFEWRRMLAVTRAAWKPLAAGTLVFAVEFGITLWIYLRGGYGRDVAGQVAAPFSPLAWLDLLWAMRDRFAYYVPALLGAVVAVAGWVKTKRWNRPAIGVGTLALVAAVTQFPLLRVTWIDTRYVYPAVVGLAVLGALGIQALPRRKGIRAAVVALSVVLSVPPALRVYAYATRFTAETKVVDQMLDYVSRNADPAKVIVVYAHPVRRMEACYSLYFQLGFRGVRSPVFLCAADYKDSEVKRILPFLRGSFAGRVDTSCLDETLWTALEGAGTANPGKRLRAADVGGIVVYESEAVFDAAPPPWYRPEDAIRKVFLEPVMEAHGWRLKLGAPARALGIVMKPEQK